MMIHVRNPDRRAEHRQAFAAKMRQAPTEAERRLWALLRSKRVGGLRFRRQQPIGPYIVDFLCAAAKLVIELDGEQHGADTTRAYDDNRTRWLEQRGYRVMRFSNGEVFKDAQRLLETIVRHCEAAIRPPGNG